MTSLAIPTAWVVDPLSLDLLERRLAAADPSCVGIVAPRVDLPPGSSARVVAERAACDSGAAAAAAVGAVGSVGTVDGAVLLRPGVEATVDGDGVQVDGRLEVEPRAVCVDPWRPVGPIEDAVAAGRSPFPYRPLVAFLGLDADPDVADWVRSIVNGLARSDTDGRIAVPAPTGGLHLTRPCAPTEATIRALTPDIVVALDGAAAAVADGWLGGNRAAVIVELTQETAATVDLVSWRLGQAQGRVRARIGRGVDAATIERLARRLCAGPQPLPPSLAPVGAVTIRRRGGRTDAAVEPRSAIALHVGGSSAARARFSGVAELAGGAGFRVAVERLGADVPPAAVGADVVFLHGASAVDSAAALAVDRRSAGRPTVVDLGPADLTVSSGGVISLTDAAARLVAAAGLATAAGPAGLAAARAAGARGLTLPTLLGAERATNLLRLHRDHRADGSIRLGWHTGAGAGDSAGGASDRAVAGLLTDLLAAHPDLAVDVVGAVDHVADLLPAHPRLMVAKGTPDSRAVVGWAAQLWTTPGTRSEGDGDLRPVVEAQLLGVPTLLGADSPAAADGLVPPALGVAVPGDPAGWRAVEALLADPHLRSRRSQQVLHRAEGLYGPTAAAAAVGRLFGWLARVGAEA